MTKEFKEKTFKDTEFQDIIKDLIENDTVQEMKKYRQHCETNCFDHCYRAAYYCYKICKLFNLNYKAATRGAMLHDLFLYDWREKTNRKGLHAYTHGRCSLNNAKKLFRLNDIEQNIILRHMWPVTIVPPKYIEGFVLTIIDKYCAIIESSEHLKNNRIIKYAYLLIGAIFFKKIT